MFFDKCQLLFLFLILAFSTSHGQEYSTAYEDKSAEELMDMSFDDLLKVKVRSVSLFVEDELKVGASVTKVTTKDWDKIGARRFKDAIANDVSLVAYPTVFGSSAIAFRGYTSNLSVRGTAYLLDGVPLNTYNFGTSQYAIPFLGIAVLDDIEVVKAPNSTIYGSDAFQGVIAMNSFERDTNYYGAKVSLASSKYFDGSINVSQDLYKNKIRLDVALSENRQGDINRDYLYTEEDGTKGEGTDELGYNNETIISKLTLEPLKHLKVKLGYSYIGANYNKTPYINHSQTLGRDYQYGQTKTQIGKAEVVYTLKNHMSIDLLMYQNHYNRQFKIGIPASEGFERETFVGETRNGLQLHLKKPVSKKDIQWLVGAELSDFMIDNYKTQDIVLDENGEEQKEELVIDDREGGSRTILGALANVKIGVVRDKFYVDGGVRYDVYSDLGGQFTPKLALIYLPTSKMVFKSIYSRGFRASTIGEQVGNSLLKGNEGLRPETLDSYELVWLFHSKKIKTNVTLFRTNWKDAIQLIPLNEPEDNYSKVYENFGQNSSKGVETKIEYYLSSFQVEAAYSYVASKSVSSNLDFVAYPKHSGLLTFNYYIKPVGVNVSLLNRIYSGWNESLENDGDELPTYWRADLNIGKQFNEHLSMNLTTRNLFNKDNSIPSVWGREGGLVEESISVMLRVGYTL